MFFLSGEIPKACFKKLENPNSRSIRDVFNALGAGCYEQWSGRQCSEFVVRLLECQCTVSSTQNYNLNLKSYIQSMPSQMLEVCIDNI